MKYLLLLGLLFAGNAYGKPNCKTHKIYCKIVKLQPKINKKFAMKLSNIIHKEARAKGIDPMLSVAILNQESSLRPQHTWKISKKEKKWCTPDDCFYEVDEIRKVFDMGIAMINIRTAISYGMDINKLFNHDLEYAIKSHFVILEDKIAQCAHLGDEAWSCYHSATPKWRKKYVKMVSRFI